MCILSALMCVPDTVMSIVLTHIYVCVSVSALLCAKHITKGKAIKQPNRCLPWLCVSTWLIGGTMTACGMTRYTSLCVYVLVCIYIYSISILFIAAPWLAVCRVADV